MKQACSNRIAASLWISPIKNGGKRYGIYPCILGGRPDLCTGPDPFRPDKTYAGQSHGPAGLFRSVLGFLGIYEPLKDFAGAGAGVPLLGFGNTLYQGIRKAVDEEGFLGLFTGGFTASAAGISAALIFSYLASLVFQPKMKE